MTKTMGCFASVQASEGSMALMKFICEGTDLELGRENIYT